MKVDPYLSIERLRVFIAEIEELAGPVGIIGDMLLRDEFAGH